MAIRKDVTVRSVPARAIMAVRAAFAEETQEILFDPADPMRDPNELFAQLGTMRDLDPRSIEHNCPMCNRTLQFDLFVAHLIDNPRTGYRGCLRRWYNTLNPSFRFFAGATPEVDRG